MTAFISRAHGGKEWEVIIKTDCKEHYKYAELFARKLIGHGKTHTMTAADHFRAMSDEELADALMAFLVNAMENSDFADVRVEFDDGYRDALLRELRQPVKDGDNDG